MLRLVIIRFLESYFRHRWLNLVPIVLMVAFAGVNYLNAKPVYISRGAFYVQRDTLLASLTSLQQDGFSWVTPADQTVDEVKELMQTDAFVRAVIQKTNLESEMSKGSASFEITYDRVRRAVWVQSLGKNLVMVGATDIDPVIAQQLSISLITMYQQWRINSDQQESVTAQQFFAGLIEKYNKDLDAANTTLRNYLDEHPDPVRGDRPSSEKMEIDRLQAVIDLSAKQLVNAIEKEEDTRLNMSKAESDVKQKYFVIDMPNLPDTPENSKKQALTNSLIFVIVGIVLCIVGIVGGALFDRTFRFPIDVRHGLNLPVLASVADLTEKPTRGKSNKNKTEGSK